MSKLTYLYLAYGDNPAVHKQSIASICSLMASDEGRAGRQVMVFTDAPDYYEWFGPLVRTEPVDDAILREWEGPSRFTFRIKPCLLLEAARHCGGALVYLDGDTLVRKPPLELESRIGSGSFILHRREYQVSDRRSKQRREYMKRLAGVDLAGVGLDEGSWMWNAGLIGLPEGHLDLPAAVLKTIDRMIEMGLSGRTRLKEQLAFSLHLEKTGRLTDAGDSVLHYWGNKDEWDAWLDRWLLKVVGHGLDPRAAGTLARESQPFPVEVAPKRSKSARRKAKLRKLLRLD